MISLETFTCPACGAEIDVPPTDATSTRCAYCRHTAQVHRDKAIAARHRPPVYAAAPVGQADLGPPISARGRRLVKGFLIVVAIVVLLPILGIIFLEAAIYLHGGSVAP